MLRENKREVSSAKKEERNIFSFFITFFLKKGVILSFMWLVKIENRSLPKRKKTSVQTQNLSKKGVDCHKCNKFEKSYRSILKLGNEWEGLKKLFYNIYLSFREVKQTKA